MKVDSDPRNTEVSHHEIRQLTAKVDELSRDVRDLVDAWNTARGLLRFVRLLGQLSIAGAGIWALFALWRGNGK